MRIALFTVILLIYNTFSCAAETKIGQINRPGNVNTTNKSLKQLQKEWKKTPLVPSNCGNLSIKELKCQKRTVIKQLSDAYIMHQHQSGAKK